jgi:hypothetical protein
MLVCGHHPQGLNLFGWHKWERIVLIFVYLSRTEPSLFPIAVSLDSDDGRTFGFFSDGFPLTTCGDDKKRGHAAFLSRHLLKFLVTSQIMNTATHHIRFLRYQDDHPVKDDPEEFRWREYAPFTLRPTRRQASHPKPPSHCKTRGVWRSGEKSARREE